MTIKEAKTVHEQEGVDRLMNLKEAFRFQNKLQSLMDQAQTILNSNQNITKVETTYLRKKAVVDAENETVLECGNSEYSDRITLMAEFLLYLLAEREKLSAAICSAKVGVPSAAGLGETVGIDIVEKRKGQEFISIEEFAMACTKVSSTHLAQLKEAGAFGDLPDSSQISFF